MNGDHRDLPIYKSPKPPWCRPPGSRPLMCGQCPAFLESCSQAASDRAIRDLRGRDPLSPRAVWEEVRSGRCRVPGPRLFGDAGAVKALSGAPGFFCPTRGAPEPAGREQGMGVGCLERRGGLRGARAGKACPEPVGMCKNFISP